MGHHLRSPPPGATRRDVQLPGSVEDMIRWICREKSLSPPNSSARIALAGLGEGAALGILRQMAPHSIRNFSGFIMQMAWQHRNVCTQEGVCFSGGVSASGSSAAEADECTSRYVAPPGQIGSPLPKPPLPSEQVSSPQLTTPSPQLIALGRLEFRKAFLILSYLGRKNLEETVSPQFIEKVCFLPMKQFESEVWDEVGRKCISDGSDLYRRKNLDWDSGKAHVYHCHADLEGNFTFRGPYLQLQRTHLQRVLGDDNVLLVKFAEEMNGEKRYSSPKSYAMYYKVAKDGIIVGLRRYQFFVFKDGGKEERKKNPTSSSVKCYFVRTESYCISDQNKPYILSDKSVHEARRVFMHVHTVSSLPKYMARFSLILSKTIKLDVDFSLVRVEVIEDIPCKDNDGNIVHGENGVPMIHTDGTGFISEDLALKCPQNIFKGKCSIPTDIQKFLDGSEDLERHADITQSRSPAVPQVPLLIQIRLFYNGTAAKGTLLLNKLLPQKTIQIRPSMIKVQTDPSISHMQSCNSLEIVTTSNQPKRASLSKYLIALLHFGGVPKEFFLDLLKNALEDAKNARYSKQAALKVALKYGDMDDFLVSRMILCGMPLHEPYLQFRLSVLMNEERKGLKAGKVPVTDCYYLMGTTDPTGLLKPNEVCVILENGQVSGPVLVYKQPGLHFGDIHVLTATYIKDMEKIVGDSKYAIFFPTKGPRSLADEMANSDFDGDMYWVSRNSQLLQYFRSSMPWVPASATRRTQLKKPTDFSTKQLEIELFGQFLLSRFKPSYAISTAADCWLSYMDRLLTLGDECAEEKECLKEKILRLVDIYYDAVDAPKSGLKVDVPGDLKAEKYPHFMEKPNSYKSTSILGLIFDAATAVKTEDFPSDGIWKLACFTEAPDSSRVSYWRERYEEYRKEMMEALGKEHETKAWKDQTAASIIQKYKSMLYQAPEFEESPRRRQEIWEDAVAIYNISYDYAHHCKRVGRCSFAWNIAGRALCMLHAEGQGEKISIPCLKSVLLELLG